MKNRHLAFAFIVILLTLAYRVTAAGESPEEANALNVAQYANQPVREATVSVKASTRPMVEGEPTPIPDINVTYPVPLPIALPQPKFNPEGNGPLFANLWQLVVASAFTIVIAMAMYPRLKEWFSTVGRKKSDPPPPAV